MKLKNVTGYTFHQLVSCGWRLSTIAPFKNLHNMTHLTDSKKKKLFLAPFFSMLGTAQDSYGDECYVSSGIIKSRMICL